MARRQVAPNLTDLVQGMGAGYEIEKAELRRVLAVVRAAKLELKFNHPCRDDWEPCSLCRALARLSRAGRKGER